MTTHTPDPSLERALTALGAHIEFPEPRDVRPAVLARIQAPQVAPATAPSRRGFRWQPAVAVAFVLLLALALMATAFPHARRAIADLLGFENLRIEVSESPLPNIGEGLALGNAVTIEEAKAEIGVVPLLDPEDFIGPRTVYVSPDALRMVSVVYGESAGLPPEAIRDASVLLTAIDGTLHEGWAEKVVHTGEAKVRPVEVRGRTGYWVSGDHAFFVYSRSDGLDELESSRIANNVLLWEEDGLILRVEGEMTRAEAIELAESLVLQD